MSDGAVAGPNGVGVVLGVEVHWCPQCRTDKTAEIVRLASDPEPVLVCIDCGTGLESWLTADMVERPTKRRRAAGETGQGAA